MSVVVSWQTGCSHLQLRCCGIAQSAWVSLLLLLVVVVHGSGCLLQRFQHVARSLCGGDWALRRGVLDSQQLQLSALSRRSESPGRRLDFNLIINGMF